MLYKKIWSTAKKKSGIKRETFYLFLLPSCIYVYVLFSKHVILLLPNTKGNERLAKLTSEHTTYMHPYKMAFISNKQNQHESFLIKNRENHLWEKKGCGLIQTRY